MGPVTWDEGKSSVGNLVTHGAEDAQCLTRSLLTPIPAGCNPALPNGNQCSIAPFLHPMGLGMLPAALYLSRASLQSHAIVAGELNLIPRPVGAGILQAAVFYLYFFPPLPTLLPERAGNRSPVCWCDVDLNCSLYVAVQTRLDTVI